MTDPGGVPPRLSADPRDGTVTGPLGTVRLEPKVMGVLQHLAEHAGQVVSRDEIFDAVWPGMVVTENTISRCIYLLRRALRDSGGDIPTIETLPKRGYRLRTPVDVLATEAVSTDFALRRDDRPAGTEPARPGRLADGDKSIAVLAFADMSPERDQEYLADGIAEELITGLAKLDALRVVARTSSFRFKGTDEDIMSIGRKLNVATILEGSVRKAGNRIRLTAQLVDASNDSHLWSESYDRELGDVFDVQDDVARRVIDALKVELGSPTPNKVINVGTTNVAAYNAYLFGMSASRTTHTQRSLARAIEFFREALEHDPEFGAAHGELGICYLRLPRWPHLLDDFQTTRHETREQARVELARARSLGWDHPSMPWIQIDRYLEATSDQRTLAREACGKVRNPDPTWRHYEYLEIAMLLLRCGFLHAAVRYFERYRSHIDYVAGEGYIPGFDGDVASMLFVLGRYDEAIQELTARLEENPDLHTIRGGRAMIYSRTGRFAEAEADLARISKVWPGNFAEVAHLFWQGEVDEARARFQRIGAGERLHAGLRLSGAILFGELEQTLDDLKELVERGDPLVYYIRVSLRAYGEKSFIDRVERHPRYRAILTKLGIDDAWREELASMVNALTDVTGIHVQPNDEH